MPESIRLYMLSKATNFSHLPVAGGWYDQHPKLIEQWTQILSAEAEEEKKKQAREKGKKKGSGGPLMGRRPSRSRARGRR